MADIREVDGGQQSAENREGVTSSLYAIVADSVEKTGTVSFQFMFSADISRDELSKIISRFPSFGWLETLQPTMDDEREAHIYVFNTKYTDGFEASIPIYPEGALNWDNAVKSIQQCVLLTDTKGFGQLEAACKQANVGLESHHYHGTLKTS